MSNLQSFWLRQCIAVLSSTLVIITNWRTLLRWDCFSRCWEQEKNQTRKVRVKEEEKKNREDQLSVTPHDTQTLARARAPARTHVPWCAGKTGFWFNQLQCRTMTGRTNHCFPPQATLQTALSLSTCTAKRKLCSTGRRRECWRSAVGGQVATTQRPRPQHDSAKKH